ncbi:hypothetical protein FQN57_006604 [Myotisia sp. PD_48]|nr:hypothetical protein FQN57_006604 [Myotisia sp. PD_48]
MERDKNPGVRPSGIPRFSRIPLPASTVSKSVRPSPSRERLQADVGLNLGRLRRPSEDLFGTSSSPSVSTSTSSRRISLSPNDPTLYHSNNGLSRRASKPSLSERTIETLSQIPPSPSIARKKSGYLPDTGIRSPSRQGTNLFANITASPRNSTFSNPLSRPAPTNGSSPRRSVSMFNHPSSTAQRTTDHRVEEIEEIRPGSPFAGGQEQQDQDLAVARANRTPSKTRSLGVRTSKSRANLNQAFPEWSSPSISKPPHPSSTVSSTLTSPTSTASKISSRTSIASDGNHSDPTTQKEPEPKKPSKSSSALRESIARAKAARKATLNTNNNTSDTKPIAKSTPTSSSAPFSQISEKDPFNLLPESGSGTAALRHKTAAARRSGALNISAMGLTEIPEEMMTMYTFDPEDNADWYESVDLTKFIAADNEFTCIPDAVFPDVDVTTLSIDDDTQPGQFGGVEHIDLHGNMITDLPLGLRRLPRLRTLNLSKNKLNMAALEVIFSIDQLTELKLAENGLEGMMSPRISEMKKLEVLDLHGNKLSALPDTLAGLTSLKVLNVAENQLLFLPFMDLQNIPLVELNARKNKLHSRLFPDSFNRHDTLQILNVTANRLEGLVGDSTVDLPNLQQLFIQENVIEKLPDVSSWKSLLTLAADDNMISEIPEGLASLRNVRYLDFTGNNIRILDDRIGSMENLVTFRIANNPLRERSLLTMDTDQLKRHLNGRCEAKEPMAEEEQTAEERQQQEEGSVETEFTLAPESPTSSPNAWRVKQGGILDRSSTNLTELEPAELEPLIANSNIRSLYLRHNKLELFPVPALSLIAHTLVDLDLSNNPLGRSGLISASLSLPHLQNLTLNTTGLTTLEPLFSHLSIPNLNFLDVSANRITGPLPVIRSVFPNLLTFLVSDNGIDGLEYEAVEGLQVLDVGNNNIPYLPPRIGLLGVDDVQPGTTALRRLEVAGNSFRVPRWQVVSKGTEAVLEHLKNNITQEEMRAWAPEE